MPLIDPFDQIDENTKDNRVTLPSGKAPKLSLVDPFDSVDSGEQPQIDERRVVDPYDRPETIPKTHQELRNISNRKQTQQREEIEALPELGQGGLLSGEDQAKVAALTPVFLSTTDPRELSQIISTNFPNVGITETKEGEILATNRSNNSTVVINKPGISKLDVMQGLGIVAAFTPAGAAATIPLRVGGAIATETAIQTAQKVAGGEFDAGEVALAGGLGAAAELAVPAVKAGYQSLKSGRQAKILGTAKQELADVSPAVKEATEAAEKTKIGLFEAQKTVVPSRLEEQSFVGSLTPGATVARKALLNQNKEAAKAVDSVLDIIAPPKAVETGAEGFRSAAIQAKERLVAIRQQKASPLYSDALKDKTPIDVSSVNNLIEGTLKDFPEGGEVSNLFKKISRFISTEGEIKKIPVATFDVKRGAVSKLRDIKSDSIPLTIKKLHNTKLEIDQMIANPNIGSTTQRNLLNVKEELMDVMEKANPGYKVANDKFSELSPVIDQFDQSILGKVAAITDTQLKTVSSKIFDAAETNPQVIAQSKKVIEEIDPQAWRNLLRVELERKLGTVRADLIDTAEGASASMENIPAQLSRAIFGNTKQRKILYEGAPDDVKQSLRFLETALNRAKLGRPGGSQTATREEIKKKLRPGIAQAVRDFFSSPITTLSKVREDVVFDKKVRALSTALYDTKWKPRMKKIRKMSLDGTASSKAMAQLLNDVADEESTTDQ